MAQRITVEAPNKVRYVLEAPDDITDDEINAHVHKLMEEDAKHQEKTGFGPAFKTGLQSGLSQLERGAAVATEELGFPQVAETLKGYSEEAAKKAQEASEKTTEEDVKTAEEQGLLSGIKAKANKAVLEKAGEFAGRGAPVIAATATGNPLAIGAAGAGEYLAGAGHINELGGSNEAALTGAAPIAVLNTLGAPTGVVTRALAGTAGKSFIADTAKNALSNVAVATPTAIASEDIARSAANKDLLSTEEMKDIGKDVLTVAPLFGAGHAALDRISGKPPAKNPLMPDYLAEKAKAQEPAPVQDNIPEPTVKGKEKSATMELGAKPLTDEGIIHDADSLTRNFDLKNAEKRHYNIWGIRNANGEGFAQYKSLDDGLNHINGLLERYETKHGVDTPNKLAHRYAPPEDNNDTTAYAKNIADHLGVGVNDKIHLTDDATRQKAIWAITRQEGIAKLNKYGNYKPYAPGEKPVVEGQPTAEAPAQLTPEQIRDQLGLGEKHPAYSTLKELDFASEEGLADAESVLNGLKETAGKKESITEDKVSTVDDIINQLKTKPNEFEAAQVEVDNLQKAHEADPSTESFQKLNAAKEQLEANKKASEVNTLLDEALGESAQPKVESVTTETAQPKTAQPEPARNPLMPDYLAAKGREQEGSISTAESDLLSNPSTVVRDPEGKLTFVQSIKDSVKNAGKNHVDKWLGLTKINEVYGDHVGDQLSAYWTGHELDNIGRIIPRALEKGGLKKMPDGRIEVVELPITLHDGSTKNASIRNMLDLIKNEKGGQDIWNELLWVTNEKRMLEKNPQNASLRATRDPEGFAKKVQNVDTILKNKPVYQDALNMLKEVNKTRVDFLKDTEQLTDDMYKYFMDNELYVPNYMLRDEASDVLGASGKKTTIGNTATRAFRERTPSDHDINPMENITNEFLRSYIGGARNNHKVQTMQQLQKIGKATYVGRTNIKGKQGNFGVLKGGKREFYQLHDPTDYPVMEILSQSVNPIMMAARASAGIIRTAATNTPNFWLRQIFIDPLGASMVSDVGWVTPLHTMYQITKALTGNKKTLDRLMDAGVVGHIDPTLDPRDARAFYKEVGTRTVSKSGLDKFKGKLRSASEYAHILIDGGTRCAVYEKAYAKGIKKGMSPETLNLKIELLIASSF